MRPDVTMAGPERAGMGEPALRTPRSEQVRIFLVNWLFTTFYGMTLGQWLRLLRRHRFEVDLPYWPRAGFITLISLANAIGARIENRLYGRRYAQEQILPPVFILGHWRSGTTYLHNLLAVDARFAYPNLYQALSPQTFLMSERYFKVLGLASPKTRLVDNVPLGFNEPQEDEFATCNATGFSPYMGWMFPRSEDYYERYLDFQQVPGEEVAQWKSALVVFLKKLTWKYNRPIVLKSPSHTCRIKYLLDLFPEARFIHIHRDPYIVFQSTKRLIELMYRATRLQRSTMQQVDERIIRRYQTMYKAFFRERELIPAGQFHELSFRELVRDPLLEIERLYQEINLPEFDIVKPHLKDYIDQMADFRGHQYPPLPATLRSRIARSWHQSFRVWGYAT